MKVLGFIDKTTDKTIYGLTVVDKYLGQTKGITQGYFSSTDTSH